MDAKHYKILVNPHGGTGRALDILESVRPIFSTSKKPLQVHVTQYPGHARELANTLDLTHCEGICIIGGDGTVHEVIGGLMNRDESETVPMGIIPGGTGNTILQHFNCKDPIDAVTRIVEGRSQTFDIAKVTTRSEITYCGNVIGWGAFSDINQSAESWRWLGPSRYAVATLTHIAKAKRRRAKLTLDDHVIEDEFLLIALCNTQFTGKGMHLAPEAQSSDGRLDVLFIRRASPFQMLDLFRKVFNGSHISLPFVETRQVETASIEHDGPDCLTLDGELKGNTPMSVSIIPAALSVLA